MAAAVALLLTMCILAPLMCKGEMELCVRSTTTAACPQSCETCQFLSEYATDTNLTLDQNSTFVFLPGIHTLNTSFYIRSIAQLTFRPPLGGQQSGKPLIIAGQNGSFIVEYVDILEISGLNFQSHFSSDEVLAAMSFALGFPFTAIYILGSREARIEQCSIMNSTGRVLLFDNSRVNFVGNRVTNNTGTWMSSIDSKVILTNNFIANNSVIRTPTTDFDVTSIQAIGSFLTTTGTNVFSGNSAAYSGVLQGFNVTYAFDGNTTFTSNTGMIAGVLAGSELRVVFKGNIHFEGNAGVYGGIFGCFRCQYNFTGEVDFVDNHASYGGVFYLAATILAFVTEDSVYFKGNSAINGGALYLSESSIIDLYTNVSGSVFFENNTATHRGGAIYIQDSNPLSYCVVVDALSLALQFCSIQVPGYNSSVTYQKRLFFTGNCAEEAGSAVYGGAIDTCTTDGSTLNVTGGEVFNSIVSIANSTAFCPPSSKISSDPYIVCYCDDGGPNCANATLNHTVYPGGSIQLEVVALGQRNGTVPATITSTGNKLFVGMLEGTQAIPNECTNITYTIFADPGMGLLSLNVEGSCLTEGVGLNIQIEVQSCPPGFVKADDNLACVCHPLLIRYTNSCSPQDGKILRASGSEFWVGYDVKEDSLILYSSCPFDYCITSTIRFRVENSDAQCDHDRSGLLCGECSEGLSLLLGTNICDKCSDDYLFLLFFFAAAGVILVAFLLLLNLTVAIGTINGLIFYANIVAANEAFVFPSKSKTYLDILKVFIAWINLDFGIKSCFYDGMDAYAKTWLQYVFPVYIWTLIGLVFLVSHFSARAARVFGRNPVAVLATLILLSYSKIIRTVIEAFSSAILDYSQGESKIVWLNDGNVPFLDTTDGRHLGLFLASLLVLVVLFIPYTLVLLTSQWLQIKSHWKVLSWLNKPQLSAFLDAYNAPYKPKHRYWTGLLLLVRLALLVTTARTLSTNPSVIFLVIQIFVLLLLVWMSFFGGVYQKWYLNVLEGFFFVNLGLLSASIHHIQYSSSTMELSSSETLTSSTAVTSTLVTAALATFLGTIVFHIYLKVNDTKVVKTITSYMTRNPEPNPIVEVGGSVACTSSDVRVPTSYVALREPLIDDA